MDPPDGGFVTQAVRSLRAGPPPPSPPILPAPAEPSVPFEPPTQSPPPPPPSSSSSSSFSQGGDTGSSASQDIQPLRDQYAPSPSPAPSGRMRPRNGSPPPVSTSPPGSSEWSLHKWFPLLVAAVTFATIFSAGPLLLPGRFAKEDGRPDKTRWVLAAGAGASGALVLIYVVRYFF